MTCDGCSLGQSSVGDFSGPRPTIDYLKELGKAELDLILEFSVWVLKSQTSQEDLMSALEVDIFSLSSLSCLSLTHSLCSLSIDFKCLIFVLATLYTDMFCSYFKSRYL
jgi:hypothetical protein